MSELLKHISDHFDGKTRHQIEVPEWGSKDKPLVVYFTKTNLKQAAEGLRLADNDPIMFQARIITIKATDKDGNRLFKMAEASELAENADPAVIARLATAMAPITSPDEAEKK